MSDRYDITELIEAIYAAAVTPARWNDTLKLLCDSLGSAGVGLFATETTTQNMLFMRSVGMPEESVIEYEQHYLAIDPRVRFGLENPSAELCYDAMHMTEAEIDRNEYYSWIGKYDCRYYVAAQWRPDSNVAGYMSFQRTRGQGHVTGEQIAFLGRLLPHIRRGVEISRRFEETDLRLEASLNTIDRLPYGVVMLDAEGAVLAMNRAASAIAAAGDGVTADGDGLRVMHRGTATAFARLVAETLAGGRAAGAAGGNIAVPRPSGRRDYVVTVASLPLREAMFALFRPAAVVFITDPESVAPTPAESLQAIFGLTGAEARLAALLVTGLDLGRCAERLGITRETARGYLKAVFAKTGTSRQAELVRLLLLAAPGGI